MLLGWYKYAAWIGQAASLDILTGPLPLGISFFTFLQIAYLVDTQRGTSAPSSFREYATFVSYFPHLIAGPILQHNEITKQLRNTKVPALDERFASAILLIVVGLAKKVLIADNIAGYVDPLFAADHTLTAVEAWTAAIGYTLQLYFDFSGYCEMALGISRLFGIEIPINFLSPYKSTSIAEFWRRWHITLGLFFRNYVYIPLGGSHAGLLATIRNLMITMVLAGLWHGAGWSFLIWGAIHGAMLVANRIWTHLGFEMPKPLGLVTTLTGVVFAWVMFRSTSIDQAIGIWSSMMGVGSTIGWEIGIVRLGVLIALLAAVVTSPNVHELKLQPTIKTAIGISFASAIGVFMVGSPTTFLYFQF